MTGYWGWEHSSKQRPGTDCTRCCNTCPLPSQWPSSPTNSVLGLPPPWLRLRISSNDAGSWPLDSSDDSLKSAESRKRSCLSRSDSPRVDCESWCPTSRLSIWLDDGSVPSSAIWSFETTCWVPKSLRGSGTFLLRFPQIASSPSWPMTAEGFLGAPMYEPSWLGAWLNAPPSDPKTEPLSEPAAPKTEPFSKELPVDAQSYMAWEGCYPLNFQCTLVEGFNPYTRLFTKKKDSYLQKKRLLFAKKKTLICRKKRPLFEKKRPLFLKLYKFNFWFFKYISKNNFWFFLSLNHYLFFLVEDIFCFCLFYHPSTHCPFKNNFCFKNIFHIFWDTLLCQPHLWPLLCCCRICNSAFFHRMGTS